MRNHHPILKKITPFLLFVLLTACAGHSIPPPPTLTFANTQTITIEGKTPIPATSMPSATITPTIEPSSTPVVTTREPTSTPTITTPTVTLSSDFIASLTAQGVVTATYGFFETQDVLDRQAYNDALELSSTQEKSFPINCTESVDSYSEFFSPDGNWLAYKCGDHTVDMTLIIVSRQGKQWILPYKDYLPEDQLVDAKPNAVLGPVHWINSDYLYFTSGLGGDWGGTCLYFAGNTALYRLNLKDGTVSAILPPSLDKTFYKFYDFSFSPAGQKLAYIITGNPVILDLITGVKTEIVVQKGSVGDLTWSPDGKELAYATCQGNQDYSAVAYSSIRIFSLDKNASRTILEANNYFYDRILVGNGNQYFAVYDFRYSSYFYYVWSSETLITPMTYPLVPTPTP